MRISPTLGTKQPTGVWHSFCNSTCTYYHTIAKYTHLPWASPEHNSSKLSGFLCGYWREDFLNFCQFLPCGNSQLQDNALSSKECIWELNIARVIGCQQNCDSHSYCRRRFGGEDLAGNIGAHNCITVDSWRVEFPLGFKFKYPIQKSEIQTPTN